MVIKRYLMPGKSAAQVDPVLRLFAVLKGRPPTAAERAELKLNPMQPAADAIEASLQGMLTKKQKAAKTP